MLSDRQEGLLNAIALAEFSYRTEDGDAELADWAWQLAADRLVEHDVTLAEAVDALPIGESTLTRFTVSDRDPVPASLAPP